MSVHYKFKSTLDYDTLTFDGLHISLKELKKSIFQQKNLGKNTDFDLLITNAQTNEVYSDENALIPKNTSLIVVRVPLSAQAKRANQRQGQNSHLPPASKDQPLQDEDSRGFIHSMQVDLARMEGSEDDKISAMMSQSTQDYDPSNYMRIRNNQTGPPPTTYRCHRCLSAGHWIKDCPLRDVVVGNHVKENVDIKKSTGIPRSFMVPVEGPLVPGAMMTPTGHFAVPAIDHQAYKEGKKERPPFASEPVPEPEKPEIPEDLLCCVCKDLLTDAVMMPCCGNSFCDDCIRTVLLESEDQECPVCHEKEKTPEMLIPNRFLRKRVADFGDQTGYRKPHRSQTAPQPQPPKQPIVTEPAPADTQLSSDGAPLAPDDVSANNEGEGVEQHKGSPPPPSEPLADSSSGAGIPVLGAPINTTTSTTHHSDIPLQPTSDTFPAKKFERTPSIEHQHDNDRENKQVMELDRERTHDRVREKKKKDKERDRGRDRERDRDWTVHDRDCVSSHPTPPHNQNSSHPTGGSADNTVPISRDSQRMGYHLREERGGTPTIDERNMDSSMHHAHSRHPTPHMHSMAPLPDMTVPPPGVPRSYMPQTYAKPLIKGRRSQDYRRRGEGGGRRAGREGQERRYERRSRRFWWGHHSCQDRPAGSGAPYGPHRGLEDDGAGYSQPVVVRSHHAYNPPPVGLPPPTHLGSTNQPPSLGGYYDNRVMDYNMTSHHDPKYGYHEGYDRGHPRFSSHNGSQPGHIDDPLEEFNRRMKMKEENEKRRDKLRQRSTRSRSYSHSRSRTPRSRSRTPRSRSRSRTHSRSRSRSRSRSLRRSLSRTRTAPPKPKARKFSRSRSRTPRRSWTRSVSRTRRSLSPRRSRTPPLRTKRSRTRTRTRSRSRSRSRSASFSISRSRSRSLSPRERRPMSPRLKRDTARLLRSRSRTPPRLHRGYARDPPGPFFDPEPPFTRGRGRGRGGRGRPIGPPGMAHPNYRKDYDGVPRDGYRHPSDAVGPVPFGLHAQHSSAS